MTKMIIIGIDPGTATTGYAAIRIPFLNKIKPSRSKKVKIKKGLDAIDYGCIKTSPKLTDGERLREISNKLCKLIKKHQPELLAIESIFFFKNLKTALPVSQAKGVILLAAAKKKIPVYEFTPLEVKMTVTGYGWAKKQEVQKEVKKLFKLKEIPKPDDVADALGIAFCGAVKNYSLRNNKKKV